MGGRRTRPSTAKIDVYKGRALGRCPDFRSEAHGLVLETEERDLESRTISGCYQSAAQHTDAGVAKFG